MLRPCSREWNNWRTQRRFCGLILAALLLPGLAASFAADTASVATESLAQDLAAKRKQLAEQVDKLIKEHGDPAKDAAPEEVSASEDELEFLQSLDEIYAQQQARLEQLQTLESEKAASAAQPGAGPADTKPASFLVLEQLRDELAGEEDREDALVTDVKAAQQLLQTAQKNSDQAEKERRRAQEADAARKKKQPASAQAVAWDLAKRRSQMAKELILVWRLEVEIRTLRRDAATARKAQLTDKIARCSSGVHFTKQDLQDRLQELASIETDFNAQLKDARGEFTKMESDQAAAIKDLQDHKALPSTIELATDSWRVARDAQQMKMSLLNEQIADVKRLHHYWSCRYETENGTAQPAEIAEWHEGLSNLVAEIGDNERSLQQHIESARLEQSKLVEFLRDNTDSAVKHWGDFQCTKWQTLRDVCETHLVLFKADQRWAQRFLDELEQRLEPPDSEKWWNAAEKQLAQLWVFEIAQVDDRPITVGKIVKLLVCMLLGVVLATILSRLLGHRLLPRLGLNSGASHAMQSIAFYSLAVLFSVASFEIVHIPLASFAFLGGAVAIAVGFGSQDIANNFMSGIILLAEQPIRVGDVVTVDDVQGTIKHIGPRSTRIRTHLNHEMIVPNSKLLSDKVTNLTLSDNVVQTGISVSLPAKLTVARAKQLLLQASASNRMVLRDPPPFVLSKQLGTTNLEFEIHFWLRLSNDMQTAIAESEVREAINEIFERCDAAPIAVTESSVGKKAA